MTSLQPNTEQTELQTFVETFPVSSPNFRRPSPRPQLRSRQINRMSRIDQIRQRNRTRERAAKTRFVATRTTTRKDSHSQLLEAMRRRRLSKPGQKNFAEKTGILAINGSKPLLSSSKKEIVGWPGLFDAELLAELTAEDRFLGPMKRAITNKDITSFNKLGAYMAQFWPKAAVVNDCVVIDNKLAIPEALRQAVLARLHRSHPGQEAMMTASEYLWWPFMNRQTIESCEKCRECTLFGKNLKPAATYNTADSLPVLSGPNQELQLDFAGPIIDEKGSKIFLLVAIDRFFKFPTVLISKTTGAKKVTKFHDTIFAYTVFLVRSEQIMVQVLTIIWCKNSALIEVLNICSRRSVIIVAVVWSNDQFRQSKANWVWRNSILISKTLKIRFIKYLKTFARVITRCLRNRLLNCILVVNLIPYGLRHVIMLFNLILQPKDWSATSLHQTRSPVTTTVGTGQKLFLVAVPVQHFQPDSNPCFHWTLI